MELVPKLSMLEARDMTLRIFPVNDDTQEARATNIVQLEESLESIRRCCSMLKRVKRHHLRFAVLSLQFSFNRNLSQSGQWGRVVFDHNSSTMQVKVYGNTRAGVDSDLEPDDVPMHTLPVELRGFVKLCLVMSMKESTSMSCVNAIALGMDDDNHQMALAVQLFVGVLRDQNIVILPPQWMDMIPDHHGKKILLPT
jgi:hypothetical protein